MNVDLALPDFAVLSGTADFAGGGLPAAATIRAADSSIPTSLDARDYIKYANTTAAAVNNGYRLNQYFTPSVWTSPTTGFTGAYDMKLAKGGDYQLTLSYAVYAGTSVTVASGTATYTPTMNEVTLNGDGTFNFTNIPSLTSLVTLTGKLTSTDGTTAIYGANVIAVSTSLTGKSNLTYRATALTDSTGVWTLKVPKGNYRVYLPSFGTPFVVK